MSDSPRRPVLRLVLGALGVTTLLCCGGVVSSQACVSSLLRWGIKVRTCPSGTPLAQPFVTVSALQRGVPGVVHVHAEAIYTTFRSDDANTAVLGVRSADLRLRRADGTEAALEPEDGWEGRTSLVGQVALPTDLPDGDHTLLVDVSTRLGDRTVEVPLPVYAPASVHLISDRPLYEPGHSIQLRAVTLRARDLVPLGQRPGTFELRDPNGTLVFEERAQSDDWGVASTSVPLDPLAELGMWRACFNTGSSGGCEQVEVTRFELPRFSVSAQPAAPWVGRGEQTRVDGTVQLASGAPVANAEVSVRWRVDGDWPMPTSWQRGELPTSATTDAAGRFSWQLPVIPEDLVGKATLVGTISAVDPLGDRVTGQVSVLLSKDDIQVDAISELDTSGALLEGRNNRLWLRATTASGAALPRTKLTVGRTWDPTAEPLTATTDDSGVAMLQIDPGAPVNVELEDPPVRPPPAPEPVSWTAWTQRPGATSASLADLRALEAAEARIDPCRDLVMQTDVASLQLALLIDGGRIQVATADAGPLGECVTTSLEGMIVNGAPRLLSGQVTLSNPAIPTVITRRAWLTAGTAPSLALEEASARARRCLPLTTPTGPIGQALLLSTTAGSRALTTRWIDTDGSQADVSCLQRAFSGLQLEQPATRDFVGQLTFQAQAAKGLDVAAGPPPTRVALGYGLSVSAATADGEELGTTDLFLKPGEVPELRLRLEPSLAAPGDTIELAALRGPDFYGTLPRKVWLQHADGRRLEAELDPKTRRASFTVPDDWTGWATVELRGAQAALFIDPGGTLDVTVASSEPVVAPGDEAVLRVQTQGADGPVAAAVTLLGVDETLGQIATLPGTDAMSELGARPNVKRGGLAGLDAIALSRGAILGENAQQAAILTLQSTPTVPELDTRISTTQAAAMLSPRSVVTDRFYTVYAELLRLERQWERGHSDRLTPEVLARLWREARDAVEASGGEVTDAYGRPLRLHQLPYDLLGLVAPDQLVMDGTRLPEDLDNWALWVAQEEPK